MFLLLIVVISVLLILNIKVYYLFVALVHLVLLLLELLIIRKHLLFLASKEIVTLVRLILILVRFLHTVNFEMHLLVVVVEYGELLVVLKLLLSLLQVRVGCNRAVFLLQWVSLANLINVLLNCISRFLHPNLLLLLLNRFLRVILVYLWLLLLLLLLFDGIVLF